MNLLVVACIFAVVPVASLGLIEVQSGLSAGMSAGEDYAED